MIRVTSVYKNTPDARFDFDYYANVVSSPQLVNFIRSGDEMLFDQFANFSVGPG